MTSTYKIRQYMQEISALKEIYDELSMEESDEEAVRIKADVARQQLMKTIHEARKSIALMEQELH